MTRPLVAAELGQSGTISLRKLTARGACLLHFDRNPRLAAANANHHLARAVGHRQDRTVIADADPSRTAGLDFRLNCQVALSSLGVDAQDDQPLHASGPQSRTLAG